MMKSYALSRARHRNLRKTSTTGCWPFDAIPVTEEHCYAHRIHLIKEPGTRARGDWGGLIINGKHPSTLVVMKPVL